MGCNCGASIRRSIPQFAFSTGPDTDTRLAEIQMTQYVTGQIASQDVELYAAGIYELNFTLLSLLPSGSFTFRKSDQRDLFNASY